jgi:hypothetical protein
MLLEWVCPWDKWTCARAAKNGHLPVLQWARSQPEPCLWDADACCYAAGMRGQTTSQSSGHEWP